MKVSKEQAAENRERILDEAARLFREKGAQGVGVDALGEAAGLTHGSLYSQFGSKDRLLAEAVERAFASFGAKLAGIESAAAYVGKYLSAEHRDDPGHGCVVAAIGSEMPRQSQAVRGIFTSAVKRRMARAAKLLPKRRGHNQEDDALGMIATLAGAMMLARAVDDPKLSDRILAAGRARLGDLYRERKSR
jgi:TetR/AcrR family transcriptional regulator, transcriptional repressor for nem operon